MNDAIQAGQPAEPWGNDSLARGLHDALLREISQGSGESSTISLALSASGIVGIWDGDLIGGRVYGDANFARIYGMDAAEVAAGKPLGHYFGLMHPDDRPEAEAARSRMMAGQGDFLHEHRVFRPDGSLIWVTARGRLLRDETGRPVRFIGVSVDITERRLSEARQAFLLQLQDTLRSLTEPRDILAAAANQLGRYLGAARIGFSEVQPDGESVRITNGYADGMPPVEGLFALSMFGANHAARMRRGETIVYQDAQAEEGGARAFGLSLGTRGHVSVSRMRDGQPTGSLYVTHSRPYAWTDAEIALIEAVAARVWDAAERGRAEARLRESEERLRLILDATGLGCWEYDAVTGATIRSARHDEIFGYPAPLTDWSYARFLTHIPQPDRAAVDAGFQAALTQGTDWNTQCRMIRADGSEGWLKISARPQLGRDGRVSRLLGSIEDITARKRAEDSAIETAEKFELFAQMLPSMVWTSLPDGSIDWFNARVPEYCGTDAAELKPDGWTPVHPDDMESATTLACFAGISPARYLSVMHPATSRAGSAPARTSKTRKTPKPRSPITTPRWSSRCGSARPNLWPPKPPCANRRRWRRWASSPAGSRMISTIC